MSVYKRRIKAGVRWGYSKMIEGKRLRTGAIFKTKGDAEEAERIAIWNHLHPPPTIPKEEGPILGSFAELCKERYRWVEGHRSKHYLKDHRKVFKKIVPAFEDLDSSEITVQMVQDFLEEWSVDLLDRGKDRYIINNAIRVMQATYNHPWGIRRGRTKRTFRENPWAEVEFFSIEKSAKYVPSHEMMNKVIMAAAPEEKVLLLFLRDTGARIGEALNCQWYDVSIPNQTVTLFTRKKRGGSLTPRRLRLAEELEKVLVSWRKRNQEKTYIFQNPKTGKGYTYRWAINRQIEVCERAKVKYFSLHSYRHYFASKLIQDGADLAKVQRLLGHESATTTNRYLHDLGVLD